MIVTLLNFQANLMASAAVASAASPAPTAVTLSNGLTNLTHQHQQQQQQQQQQAPPSPPSLWSRTNSLDDGMTGVVPSAALAAAAAALASGGGGGGCGSGDNASGSTASDEGVDPIADAVSRLVLTRLGPLNLGFHFSPSKVASDTCFFGHL